MQMDKNALAKGQVLMIATSCGTFEHTDIPTGLWYAPYVACA